MIAQTLQKSFPTAAYSLATGIRGCVRELKQRWLMQKVWLIRNFPNTCTRLRAGMHANSNSPPDSHVRHGCTNYRSGKFRNHVLLVVFEYDYNLLYSIGCFRMRCYFVQPFTVGISSYHVEASPCGNRGTAVRRSRVSEVILPDHLISLVFIGSTNNFLFGQFHYLVQKLG